MHVSEPQRKQPFVVQTHSVGCLHQALDPSIGRRSPGLVVVASLDLLRYRWDHLLICLRVRDAWSALFRQKHVWIQPFGAEKYCGHVGSTR